MACCLLLVGLIAGAGSTLATGAAAATLPNEDECPKITLEPDGSEPREDAVAVAIEPGMVLGEEDLMLLRQLIPKELWRHREVFFHEGMRIEVGPCHRRYPQPDFFRTATERFAGQSRIDAKGNLANYTAGLPFPLSAIADDEEAGARWAFNLEQRYVGAALRGKFRITDLPGRVGRAQIYDGNFYYLKAAHRADLADTDYRIPSKKKTLSAAGGEFTKPFNARHLAWRQFRPARAAERHGEPDDVFTYIPSMRKSRRAAASWVDGLYVPRYTVSGDDGGGSMQFGEGASINPTAGRSIAVSENMRRGFVGFTLRANAYHWRLLGERDVLAPLNSSNRGYPLSDERNFGTSGLSLANDRWDLRRVVLIEGAARKKGRDVASLVVAIDMQTQQPLYWFTRTARGRLLDVGALAYQFSDDLPLAPQWPGGKPASVFLPVAAVFFDAGAGAGGWRRESFELDATPVSKQRRQQMMTSSSLDRGR
ncbi:MAG: DUF1329 domain-containing protein [Myxococcota bacterium]|nr:DUF1329 domain-containing protein [Myxococcota bacterium]